MALLVLGGHLWFASIPNRHDKADTLAPVRFAPARFDPAGFAPFRLAGAWRVEVADPRFGGVSALAIDRGKLVALTDSGTVVRLPMPGTPGRAVLHDLGAGPGSPGFKGNRDSEALARDPAGRGWWVAFERSNQLWLYDPGFTRALHRIDFGKRRWRRNKGIEAMIAGSGGLTLFPEGGREWLTVGRDGARSRPLRSRFGNIADAATAPDGRLLLVTRKAGMAGLAKQLVTAEEANDGVLELRSLARLGLGATDNVEAIALEPRPGGARLWLMTDNDFRPRAPTYLVALDWP